MGADLWQSARIWLARKRLPRGAYQQHQKLARSGEGPMSNFVFSANPELEPVTIEFADGTRSLPEHILRAISVQHLHSVEKLAVLNTINWADFLAETEKEISRASLNARFF